MLNLTDTAGGPVTLRITFGEAVKAGLGFSIGAAVIAFISLLVWTQVMPIYARLSLRAIWGM